MATQLRSPGLKVLYVSLVLPHTSGTCPQCTTQELSSGKALSLQTLWQCCSNPLTLSLILFYQAFLVNY